MAVWTFFELFQLLLEVDDCDDITGVLEVDFWSCAFDYMYMSLSYVAVYWTWGTAVFGVFTLLLRPFAKVVPDEIETDRNEWGF